MTDLSPLILILTGVLVGALVGGLGALIALRRGEGGTSARSLQRELDAYRDEVATHYSETAKRVDALTQAYKSVYDHLEQGAFKLVGEEELRRRLDDDSAGPVTLEGIGRRALDEGTESSDTELAGSDHDAEAAGESTSRDTPARDAASKASVTSEADPDEARRDAASGHDASSKDASSARASAAEAPDRDEAEGSTDEAASDSDEADSEADAPRTTPA